MLCKSARTETSTAWRRPLCQIAMLAIVAVLFAACAATQTTESTVQDLDSLIASDVALPDVDIDSPLMTKLISAEILHQRGNDAKSAELLYEIATASRDYRVADLASRRAVTSSRFDIARHATQLWIELAPQSSHAWWIRGITQVAINDIDGAVASFVQMLSLTEDSKDTQQALFGEVARTLHENADPKLAYEIVKEILNQFPDNVTVILTAVRFAIATGEDHATIDGYLDRAYDLDPQPHTANTRFALYVEQGRNAEAVDYIKKQIRIFPDSEILGFSYAAYLAETGMIKEALKHLEQMDSPQALFQAAGIYYASNQLPEALDLFMQYLEQAPNDGEALINLAEIQLSLGLTEQARGTIDRVTERALFFERWLLEVHYAAESGAYGEAISMLDRMQKDFDSTSRRIRIHLAKQRIYHDQGMLEQAKSAIDAALEEFPDNTQLLLSRSLITSEQKRVDLVESDLKIILDQHPDNAHALNALGYTLTDLTERHDEALTYIQKALDLRPHDPYILDSMGWVMYKLGRTEDAIEFLRRAYSIRLDPVIAAHLGEVYFTSGMKRRARKIWQEALQRDPDDLILNQTIRTFSN